MNIIFQTEEQLIDYLILDKKVEWNPLGKYVIKFGGQEFKTELDFLEHLKSFDLITYTYESIISDTFKWKREERKFELRLKNIQLNKKNLDLLYSDNLITSDIHQHRLLTINQVCDILGVTRPTVYKFFEDGTLSYYEILSQRKVRHTDLMNFIEKKKNI
jgi:excisionase family DNA binding protein